MKHVEVYWSHQSPYCYFALDRILRLHRCARVCVALKLVLPGVLRNAGKFVDASALEERYFCLDTERTAQFLGVPYGVPRPWPVECEPGTLYRAGPDQPRAYRLYHLNQAAIELGKGLEFLDAVTRLIWCGETSNWHETAILRPVIEKAGFDYDGLTEDAQRRGETFMQTYAQNDQDLQTAGHWGVPVFVYNGEPFYGQDRFDQLLWRLDS